MNNTKYYKTAKSPDPFDGSAHTRLRHMQIYNNANKVSIQTMTVFSSIFTGLFFDDLRESYETSDLLAIYEAFKALNEKEEYTRMYLLISILYDYMRKPLPDPVWWLAGDSEAITAFMIMFIYEYERLYTSEGILKPGEWVVPE